MIPFKAKCPRHGEQMFVDNLAMACYECVRCVDYKEGALIEMENMSNGIFVACIPYEVLYENPDGDDLVYESIMSWIVGRDCPDEPGVWHTVGCRDVAAARSLLHG